MKGADPRINQNILFFIIKTYGYFFFRFYISVLYITKEEVPARDRIEREGKKMRCKLTPSYSILLLLFLLFFFSLSLFLKLFVASFHRFVPNQLRYLFANLEHLLLRKKGSKRKEEIFKKKGRNKRKRIL